MRSSTRWGRVGARLLLASIRGVGAFPITRCHSSPARTHYYIDGVYLGRPQGAILDLLGSRSRRKSCAARRARCSAKNAVGRHGKPHFESAPPATAPRIRRRRPRRYFKPGVTSAGRTTSLWCPTSLFARAYLSLPSATTVYVDVLDYECGQRRWQAWVQGGTGIPGQLPIKLGSSVGGTEYARPA